MFPAAQIILKTGILPTFTSEEQQDSQKSLEESGLTAADQSKSDHAQADPAGTGETPSNLAANTSEGEATAAEAETGDSSTEKKDEGQESEEKPQEEDPGKDIRVRDLDADDEEKRQKSYQEALKGQQVNLIDDLENHHYCAEEEAGASNVPRLTKISQDIKEMTSLLPCDYGHSCFIRINKKKMQFSRAIIFGAHDTPYAHGAFMYDIFVEEQYPEVPPKVNIMTTGGGTLRFNPNLYESGLVCLSLLGTWDAEFEDQKWNAKTSNMGQVLLSIQSLVMNENVIENEPDYDWASEDANEAYSNIIKFGNVKYAMIDMIKNPPKGFEKIIKTHFYYKRELILADVEKWITEARDLQAEDYGDLVSDHNSDVSSKFRNTYGYKKALIEQYEILKTLLSELTLEEA